ncbi:MAG: hypothetical protein IIC26_05060, partial [Chloroflexi bacterium]|nr:hypothetical protein [Chloroflexota bacterium]
GLFDTRGTPSAGDACPAAVGGVAELPEVAGVMLEATDSSGDGAGVLASVLAGVIAAGTFALAGAAWYARRRVR